MPPKKKSGTAGVIIDGVNTGEMTREKLEIFCLRLKEELEREREERNFFQLERDKLRTFWEITKTELDETRAKLRNTDRQIQESIENNEEELKLARQKIKFIQFEHSNDLTEAKAEYLVSIKLAQDDHVAQENELLRDKRDLKQKIREQEFLHQEQIKQLKLEQSERISNVRKEFENRANELEMKYEKQFEDLKQELNTKFTMEMAEIEERKNNQINDLVTQHEKAFNDMKNYYNDITLNNLALISSLKDQLEVLRKQNEAILQQISYVTAENRKLIEPLKHARIEVAEYRKKLENYEKEKLALQNTKLKLSSIKKELNDAMLAHTALELRYEKLKTEKDELDKRFVDAILEIQQKSGRKNVVLQKKLEQLTHEAEFKDVMLNEIAQTTKETPFNTKLKTILSKKNATIHDLQYELARVCKAHDDLLNLVAEKLKPFGISVGCLGLVPLEESIKDF